MARTLHKGCSMLVTRRKDRKHASGFTLVELAVVVTIVGVLSVIAVVGYRRLILSSKLTEAENMVSAIRIAQEQYKAERGIYANVGPNLCPAAGGVGKKAQWDTQCPGGGGVPSIPNWSVLPVHSDGPVELQYSTIAGPPGAVPQGLGNFVNVSAADTSKPWYTVTAEADLSAGGLKTAVWTSSFGNQVFSQNVGE